MPACREMEKVHFKMCEQQRHEIILLLVKLFHVQCQALCVKKAIDHLQRME